MSHVHWFSNIQRCYCDEQIESSFKNINELKIYSLPLHVVFITDTTSLFTSMIFLKSIQPRVSHLKRLRKLGLRPCSSFFYEASLADFD